MNAFSVDLLRELTEAHGAPGGEREVAAVVRKYLPGYQHASDRLGSVICRRTDEESGPTVLVAAHMDEVGFAIQSITAEGFLSFVPLGGWWTHTLLAQRVRVRTSGGTDVVGVIGSIPVHFLRDGDRDKVRRIDDLYIDVGADSRQEAREVFGIREGDPVVPDVDLVRMQHPDRLMAKAFDNRVGMGLLIECLRELAGVTLPNRLVGVGTVQEELGCRGADAVGPLVNPDVALVLEGPPADDSPGFSRDTAQGRLGGGVQIRMYDPTTVMNRPLLDWVIATAEAHGIAHQVAVRRHGGTDARSFQRVSPGVPVVVIGVPARYIHSHQSIIDMRDYRAALELMVRLVRGLDQHVADSWVAT